MEEQSGREFASADPPAGAQDATLQEPGLGAKIPLHPHRRLQHFQRPTPSHVSSNTPRAIHRRAAGSIKKSTAVFPTARVPHLVSSSPSNGRRDSPAPDGLPTALSFITVGQENFREGMH